MSKAIRTVVVVSDIHAGSVVALMPPAFTTADGQKISQNPLQRWFWDCWQRSLAWLDDVMDGDPAALVLNGDLIEGDHHRTTEIVSRNIEDHLEIARILLDPLTRKCARTFVTRGTECHTGNTEHAIGKLLGAEQNPETKRHAFDRLTLDICGLRFVARHNVSTTSRPWLEANGLGMELAAEQLSAVRNGEPMPRVLAVAHRHVGGHVVTGDGLCLATPAWQGLTRHGHKVVPASRCRPGLYVLDWRNLPDGTLPRVHRRLFEAPHAKAIKI